MEKRITAHEFASQVYNNYGHGNCNAVELITARDKATLEAAAERIVKDLSDLIGTSHKVMFDIIRESALRDEED